MRAVFNVFPQSVSENLVSKMDKPIRNSIVVAMNEEMATELSLLIREYCDYNDKELFAFRRALGNSFMRPAPETNRADEINETEE
jgi:hypothetical protein